MAIDYDEILSYIGELGTWQKRLFLLLAIPSATSAMAVFMYDFIAFVPDHRCVINGCDVDNSTFDDAFLNFTVPWEEDGPSSCNLHPHKNFTLGGCTPTHFNQDKSEGCEDWIFQDDLIKSTAVEDFEMVCENKSRKSLTQTMYMVGMLIGSFLFGWLSDLIGRKTTMMVGLITLSLGGSLPFFVTPSASNFYSLVIFRFLSGMGHVGTFMMAFNLALECVGTKYRTMFGILIETPFAIGGLIVGIVSYAGVRDWRTLTLVLSAPNILVIFLFLWALPESPRWLISKRKKEKLLRVLDKAAKINKKHLPIDQILEADRDDEKLEENNPKIIKSATVLDLFWPPTILLRSSIMFFNWMVTTMCYYGLTSAASTLTPDLYLNYSLAILVEIPAHFVCILILDRLGRKPVLGFAQLLAGVTCIGAGFMGAENLRWIQISLSLIGKFGATASFAIVFVYTAEMFPTEIRSTAVGASSLCGRIGGILAPQIAMLDSIWGPLPLLVMGTGSLIGGILVFVFLPETLGKKLPDSMQEALNL